MESLPASDSSVEHESLEDTTLDQPSFLSKTNNFQGNSSFSDEAVQRSGTIVSGQIDDENQNCDNDGNIGSKISGYTISNRGEQLDDLNDNKIETDNLVDDSCESLVADKEVETDNSSSLQITNVESYSERIVINKECDTPQISTELGEYKTNLIESSPISLAGIDDKNENTPGHFESSVAIQENKIPSFSHIESSSNEIPVKWIISQNSNVDVAKQTSQIDNIENEQKKDDEDDLPAIPLDSIPVNKQEDTDINNLDNDEKITRGNENEVNISNDIEAIPELESIYGTHSRMNVLGIHKYLWKFGNNSKVKPVSPQSNLENEFLDEIFDPLQNLNVQEESIQYSEWVPPDIDKAKEYRKQNVFLCGTAPFSVKVTSNEELSEGICAYFEFLKSVSIYMLVCTLLSLPGIIFSYYGTRISAQDRDSTGLYRFTIGNIGFDQTSSTYNIDSRCSATSSTQCVSLPNGFKISFSRVSYILMAMELCQDILFVVLIIRLRYKVSWLTEKLSKSACLISDYSIMVRHLPNCTVEEISEHFSNLYSLDVRDWRNRPIVKDAEPVIEYQNTGNPFYLGKWVAEGSIRKAIGSFLLQFKHRQKLIDHLFKSKTLMKMYSSTSTHRDKDNSLLYSEAEMQVRHATKKLTEQTRNLLHSTKVTLERRASIDATGVGMTTAIDLEKIFQAKITAAFICFEYSESKARAIEDYTKYSRFPWSLSCFYPKELLFKGKKISVRHAPEPDAVIWENLEVSTISKYWKRGRTALIALILSIGCFIAIVQATSYKNDLASKIPPSLVCSSTIPELYTNSFTNTSISDYVLVRPSNSNLRDQLDSSCSAIVSGTFYAVYTLNGDETKPVASYSLNACRNQGVVDLCPVFGDAPYCPCVSTTSTDQCQSAPCTSKVQGSCFQFAASDIGTCYCTSQLFTVINSHGALDAVNRLKQLTSSNICKSVFVDYTASSLFIYVAVIITVTVNQILLFVLRKLTEWECHTSVDRAQGSLVEKIFQLTFTNLAFLIIIASGYLKLVSSNSSKSSKDTVSDLHILQGTFRDFTPAWYGNIGSYFLISFILQSPLSALDTLYRYYIEAPFRRMWNYSSVRARSNRKIVRQSDLNKLEVGPVFDGTDNQALLLALLFFAMTYGAGLTLMPFLCFITFSTYFYVEKLALLRYCHRPPHVGSASVSLIISWMPYALALRLAIASWMFSSSGVVLSAPSTEPSSNLYNRYLRIFNDRINENAPVLNAVSTRLLQPQAFPFLFLLVVLILVKLWADFFPSSSVLASFCKILNARRLFFELFNTQQTFTKDVISPFEIQSSGDDLRQEVAGFTKEYYKYIIRNNFSSNVLPRGKVDDPLSKYDRKRGWEVIDKDGQLAKIKYRDHAIDSGRKKTFELIQEYSCASYALDRIPAYEDVIRGLIHVVRSLIGQRSQRIADDL